MYDVGFGDCFLLSIEYAGPLCDGRNTRSALIDFGSFHKPRNPSFVEVAELIAEHCGGKLDVIVASHRDRDHIAGFADREAFEVLRTLSPDLIVRPWTDDPRGGWSRDEDDSKLIKRGRKNSLSVAARASSNLLSLTARTEHVYLHAGEGSIISEHLPDADVFVLGPPDGKAWNKGVPSINNTSLILLFKVSCGEMSKYLLFPGDAEIGSWSHAFGKPKAVNLLEKVDLYKIGHHGSEGATPSELVRIWRRDPERKRVGLLSTQSGVYGRWGRGEIPSRRLLGLELRKLMRIVSIENYRGRRRFVELVAPISSRSAFSIKSP
jgi:hypothetical protein